MTTRLSTAGYSEDAETLIPYYEAHSFEDIFADILHLFPVAPCRTLDIGAGTGRHAAALARRGHAVTAVEPIKKFRDAGRKLHATPPLTWVDDALPELEKLASGPLAEPYGCILMAAVLMHFDAPERAAIMRRVAGLLAPGGRCILSLRHGPVPEGRRMFAISHTEIIALAEQNGMAAVFHTTSADVSARPGVSWTMLCLDKSAA